MGIHFKVCLAINHTQLSCFILDIRTMQSSLQSIDQLRAVGLYYTGANMVVAVLLKYAMLMCQREQPNHR